MDIQHLPPLTWLGLALILCGIVFPLADVFSVAVGVSFAVVGIFFAWYGYTQRKHV